MMSKFGSKLILFGEHSIVYEGHRSIILPLEYYSEATVFRSESGLIEFKTFGNRNLECRFTNVELNEEFREITPENFAKNAINISFRELINAGVAIRPVRIELETRIPQGGFGASASFGASIIDSIFKYFNRYVSNEELINLVRESENFQHGKSSGVDPAAIITGKPVIYTNGKGIEILDFDRNYLESLNNSIHIISTGRNVDSAGFIISKVREQFESNRCFVENIFADIENNIDNFLVSIKIPFNLSDLIEVVNKNGLLLEKLCVVSDPVIEMSKEVRNAGYGIKISGAGGYGNGGSGAVIIVGADQTFIENIIQKYASNTFNPQLLAR